ncbi:heparinase II/III-family protein [Alphaproteobacteria bacterium]|nr:heparinase II/III-family protein [Alphaproteobacteria bacterium]
MINFLYQNISRNLQLVFLRLGLGKTNYRSFTDLNFKQNDFINYKIIKYYIFKDNFVINSSAQDIHTFNFLFFYQKIGGKKGIELSKQNIFLWFNKFKYNKNFLWDTDLAAKRFINLIYNYDFVCSISNQKEISKINKILNFHIKRINFEISLKNTDEITSSEILALVLIECCKNSLNTKINERIDNFINLQIDENTMHRSYNILEHAKFLNNLIEIRNIFLFFNIKASKFFKNNILGMTSILKIYQHYDSSLPLFNGCNNNHTKTIEKIYEKEQFVKTKTLTKLKNGIAVYKDLKKILFFDVVQPSALGFHKDLGAGSLAIEISAYGEKIITNCGGSEIAGKNPAYLKYSAAHSTIVLDNTNVSEIKENNFNKDFIKRVNLETKDNENLMILAGTHNGYLTNYKKICKRTLFISKQKELIKGEDTIISSKSIIKKNVYHIRFHLMPEISTTITENKKNIIVKTKKNNIWMFRSDREMVIEKSIFVKNDIAIETSQIVISGITSMLNTKIEWSLEKI